MAPPASTSQTIVFTKSQQENLQHLSNLLHLFHHRNHNQHRRSIWNRHFSTFRKQLALLISENSELNVVPGTHLERSRKVKRDDVVKERVQSRLKLWREVFVPKWHLAFGQLVADGRFAALGLVLVGVLGEVCEIVGVTRVLDEVGDEEVREAIERFGREEGVELGSRSVGSAEDVGKGGEDVGVAVMREGAWDGTTSLQGLGKAKRGKMGEVKAENVIVGREDGRMLRSAKPAMSSTAQDAEADSEMPLEANTMGDASSTTKTLDPAPNAEATSPAGLSTKRGPSPPSKSKVVKKQKTTKKTGKKGDAIDDLFSGLG